MGQMGLHPAHAPGRPPGRDRGPKSAKKHQAAKSIEDLIYAPGAAGGGVRKAQAEQLFRALAATSGLIAGKLRIQLIPDSTWKRAGETLGPSASETVARLAHALFLAERIWQNRADAIAFLLRPHVELGQVSPYSLLRSESGGRRVESLLAALEFGFPV